MQYLIPDLKKIQEASRQEGARWGRKIDDSDKQNIVPEEPLSIKGVPDNSTILVFAGNTGEVARMLRAKKIIFTDMSKERIGEARRRAPKEFRKKADFVQCDAFFLPLKDNCADFAFSFEPLPIMAIPFFLLGLIRCSRKGIIIAQEKSGLVSEPAIFRLGEVARKYGIKVKWEKIKVKGAATWSDSHNVIVFILNLQITDKIKRRARTDLEIIGKANEIVERGDLLTKEKLEEIRKSMHMFRFFFKRSLGRIAMLQHNTIFSVGKKISFIVDY